MHSLLDRCLFILPISIHAGFFGLVFKDRIHFKITLIPTSCAWPSLQKNNDLCITGYDETAGI